MIIIVVIITWIVYSTNANIRKKPLKGELHQTAETAILTPLDPKESDPVIASTIIDNSAIDRVGFVCCLTTMLFFAAPLSTLVSVTLFRQLGHTWVYLLLLIATTVCVFNCIIIFKYKLVFFF